MQQFYAKNKNRTKLATWAAPGGVEGRQKGCFPITNTNSNWVAKINVNRIANHIESEQRKIVLRDVQVKLKSNTEINNNKIPYRLKLPRGGYTAK